MNEVASNEEKRIVLPSGAPTDNCPACHAGPDFRLKTMSSEFCGNCGHEYGGTNG